MKYYVLILLIALPMFGQQRKVGGRLKEGSFARVPLTWIPKERTNVLVSITSTNWPKQPNIGTLQLYICLDLNALPQVWQPLTNDISGAVGDTVTVNVPLQPQPGNERRVVKGLLRAHKDFDAVIEVK